MLAIMSNKPKPTHLLRGENSERIASLFLMDQGLKLIDKNFQCKYGELDLVMREGDTIVIVEVRFRKSNKFGGAAESVTPKKQSRIIASTEYYLLVNKLKNPIRFDVIAMSGDTDINWIKNAF